MHHTRHAVDERLDADEAGRRFAPRAMQQMLAAAEADLEPHLADRRPEQAGQRIAAAERQDRSVVRQELGERGGLQRPDGLAVPAAEESFGRPAPALASH